MRQVQREHIKVLTLPTISIGKILVVVDVFRPNSVSVSLISCACGDFALAHQAVHLVLMRNHDFFIRLIVYACFSRLPAEGED